MPVITIPFDYDARKYDESLVPIFLNDTDERGEPIYFGWIEAVVPVQDKLRSLSRRVLGDTWRVSELTEITVHHLWRKYHDNLGPYPSHRVYSTARRKAHGLEDPGERVHRGKNIALDALDEYRRDALLAEVVNLRGEISREYDLSRLEAKLRELGTEKDSEIYRQVKFGYYWREIGENVKEHPNTVYRRFSRLLKKVRDAI
jgi:DNA-directed RNA polymerase specialized sigma24 family protein